MTTVRKNPLFDNKKQSEMASIEKGNNSISHIEDTSFCPVCNKKMEIINSNKVPSYVCFTHHINLPMKD